MRKNKVLQKLSKNEPVSVAAVWTVPHWKIIEMIGLQGYDCVWIEMEHSDFTWDQVSQMILAARATGMEAMVRVGRGGYNDVIRPLEAGATGLLLPQCTGAEDAEQFVQMARFAPRGWRGVGGSVDARYGLMPFEEYVTFGNQEVFLAVMIERREALNEVEKIAAVEGLDLLFVGPADLSQNLGCMGQWDHPLIREAIHRVADACARHGKSWGTAGGMSLAEQRELGARFFNLANEMDVLVSGFQLAKEAFDASVR